MEPSFEKLLVRLADAGVEFLVVGGVAVTLHGYARLTEDVDILIRRTPENIARLLDSLATYGEGFARELNEADFAEEEGAIRIVEESEQSQIDIFTQMSGLKFDEAVLDAATFALARHQIRYPSKATSSALRNTLPATRIALMPQLCDNSCKIHTLSTETQRDLWGKLQASAMA